MNFEILSEMKLLELATTYPHTRTAVDIIAIAQRDKTVSDLVEWLESHKFGHLEKTYEGEGTPVGSLIFTIPAEEWESLKEGKDAN